MIRIITREEYKSSYRMKNGWICIDMSNRSDNKTAYLSPYFPWGNIPVPFSTGLVAESVMAIWEGLKVLEGSNIDKNVFSYKTMDCIKHSHVGLGNHKGYRKGLNYDYIYDEDEAFKRIFIPSYRFILEYKAYRMVNWLRSNIRRSIILVDDLLETIPKQLTPANLLKLYVLGELPFKDVIQTKIQYHYYCGRRELTWTTKELTFKSLPPVNSTWKDGIIEFDFDDKNKGYR